MLNNPIGVPDCPGRRYRTPSDASDPGGGHPSHPQDPAAPPLTTASRRHFERPRPAGRLRVTTTCHHQPTQPVIVSPGCVCRAGSAERAPDELTQGFRGRLGSIYDFCMRCLTLQGGERCGIDDFPLFCAATARKNSQQSHSRSPAITTHPKLVGGDIVISPQNPLSAPRADCDDQNTSNRPQYVGAIGMLWRCSM